MATRRSNHCLDTHGLYNLLALGQHVHVPVDLHSFHFRRFPVSNLGLYCIPANPTDSRGSLPLFYSSQRIPILLVRHTAFGNCYWKQINSCVFFSFAFDSHCQDGFTRGCFYILQNAAYQNAGETILLHFFENFPRGHATGPP